MRNDHHDLLLNEVLSVVDFIDFTATQLGVSLSICADRR
jgi:hypothetical protein